MDKLICSCGKKKYEFQDKCWSCDEKDKIKSIWDYECPTELKGQLKLGGFFG
jgi:hypothetical protein